MLVYYTEHARKRVKQRSISPELIEILLSYGDRQRSFGADRVTLSRESCQELAAEIGEVPKSLADVFAVVSDNEQVITVGWKNRNFRRR